MAVNLVFFTKKGLRKDVPLSNGVTVLGRRPDCDVRIPVGYVSRKHCRIINRQDKTLVQDLGSANGTFINSQRIMEAVINAGDRLSVGPMVFTVQIDGKPAEIVRPGGQDLGPTGGQARAGSSQGKTFKMTEDRVNAKKAVDFDDSFPESEPLADIEKPSE